MRKVLPCILLITACSGLEDTFTGDDPPAWTCPVSLTEDRSVYQGDDGIVVMELTIEDLDGLAAVDANVDDASVAATFREGAFSAPATVKLRGQSTRLARQKSYKVKLESGEYKKYYAS